MASIVDSCIIFHAIILVMVIAWQSESFFIQSLRLLSATNANH